MSFYKKFAPPAELKNYVEFLWIGEIERNPGEIYIHHAFASSKVQLLFHYKGNFVRAGVEEKIASGGFYGPTSIHTQYVSQSRKAGILGVQFFPQALSSLFSIPASELTNSTYDIELLLGKEGQDLRDQVILIPEHDKKVEAIFKFLISRIRKQKVRYENIEQAIREINQAQGQAKLSELIEKSCVSERQFERSFKELSGFPPKLYQQIVRFESILCSFKNTSKSFSELARDFGYYDQPHFNRDFKKFTGQSPSQYFKSIFRFLPVS